MKLNKIKTLVEGLFFYQIVEKFTAKDFSIEFGELNQYPEAHKCVNPIQYSRNVTYKMTPECVEQMQDLKDEEDFNGNFSWFIQRNWNYQGHRTDASKEKKAKHELNLLNETCDNPQPLLEKKAKTLNDRLDILVERNALRDAKEKRQKAFKETIMYLFGDSIKELPEDFQKVIDESLGDAGILGILT